MAPLRVNKNSPPDAVFGETGLATGRIRPINELTGPGSSRTQLRWRRVMTSSQHIYEVRPRKDKRGVDLICDVLPFGGLWYGEPTAIRIPIGTDS